MTKLLCSTLLCMYYFVHYSRDLHDNDFDHLPIPKIGWPELRYLYLYDVPSLYRAPEPKHCSKLQGAVFTYTYHCCAFKAFSPPDRHEPASVFSGPVTGLPSRIQDIDEVTSHPDTRASNKSVVCDFYERINQSHLGAEACGGSGAESPILEPPRVNKMEIEIVRRLAVAAIPPNNTFVCYPQADPMASCEYLPGSWPLRVLIWVGDAVW